MSNPDERLDVINEQDEVVGSATKSEIYAQRLPHRIVHVLVSNHQDGILLQLRSPHVSFRPNHWSTAAGGHVQSGEGWLTAAQREYFEELGVTSPLTFLKTVWYTSPLGHQKHLGVFRTHHDGPFVPSQREVEKLSFFSKDALRALLNTDALIHPELRFLVKEGLI